MTKKPTYADLEKRIHQLEKIDIEHRAIKKKLRRSEALLNSTEQLSKIGGWEWDVETQSGFWTDTLYHLHGFQNDDSLSDNGKKIEQSFLCYAPEYRPYLLEAFNNCVEKGQAYDLELPFCSAKGERKWVRTLAKPVYENGEIVKIIGNFMDVSERKQAEEALKRNEQRLIEAQKVARLGHYIIDIKADCWTSSKELNAIFGIDDTYKRNHISWVQLVHSDHREEMSAYFQDNVLIQHEKFDKKYKILNPRTGQEKWVHGLGVLKFDENNHPVEMLGTIQDITEEQLVQQQLNDTRLQFETVLNSLDLIVYISDMESHEILFMNTHMQKLYGKDLIGNICWKSFHKNMDGPCEFCTNDKLIDAKGNIAEPYVCEFLNQKLDIWYELRDQAILWTDGRLVRLEIASDITDRKQVELDQNNMNKLLEEKIKKRTEDIENVNAALRVLLKKRDEDKMEIDENLFSNYRYLILPFFQKLKGLLSGKDQKYLMGIIESNLKELLQPFSQKLSDPMVNLSPTEIQIASMVKQGLSNKEMAHILNNSIRTITNHRQHIRTKLNLKNKKINLRTYLSSL